MKNIKEEKLKVSLYAPLRDGDTEKETDGCRHTNPDLCGKNSMLRVCAFVREDGRCMSPPRSWPKQYRKLKEELEASAKAESDLPEEGTGKAKNTDKNTGTDTAKEKA